MKILFFSPYYYPYTSGITTYPQKLFLYLSKQNEIETLTFKYDKKLRTEEIINKYKITRMNYWFKISKGFISPQSIFYFFNKINKYDLVILNQPNFEGLFLAIIAKIFRKKIISIFHCQVFFINNFWNKIISNFLNFSMKVQLFFSTKIVAYTEDYFDSLADLKQFKDKTVFTLPPIDNPLFDVDYLNKLKKIKKTNIWIGYSGRIASEKGIEYLVQSINRLNIKKNTKLVFAGPYGKNVAGENNYYNKIVKMLKIYKIKHSFFGNLTSKQLSSFYRIIDILVLPSINQTEAFGMVQAEAMITGTPVVASNLPGVRIAIKLTKMGKIFEPRNSKQLSETLSEVLNNKDKFSNIRLVKNAQEIFDIKKVYKFYDKLIRQ